MNKESFGESIWSDNQLLLSANIFKEMNRCEVTFKQLAEFKEEYIKFRNNFFKGSPCNTEIYLQRNGNKFAFSIYYPSNSLATKGEFNLWYEGHEALGECEIDEKSVPGENFIKWLDEKISNKLEGKINCSDCGKIISEKEIAGRYFAGQYCKECWEGKWKEIESKETYN